MLLRSTQPNATAHTPADVYWVNLPDDYVLQIHWYPIDTFKRLLATHGFQLVSIMRHPLDVLASIHQFSQREQETWQCLGRQDGNKEGLQGTTPVDESMVEYATSQRYRSLLGASA